MTRLDQIKNMNNDELVEFLSKLDNEDSPWNVMLNQRCSYCPIFIVQYEDEDDFKHEVAFCEKFNKCIYFPEVEGLPSTLDIVKLWLNEEV